MFGPIYVKTMLKRNRERSERKQRENIQRLGHTKFIGPRPLRGRAPDAPPPPPGSASARIQKSWEKPSIEKKSTQGKHQSFRMLLCTSILERTFKSFTLVMWQHCCYFCVKGNMSDSATNYNYVGNTKVSASIKKTNAHKCTFSEIFLTEILKSFSVF